MFAIDRPEVQKFCTEKRLDVQVQPNSAQQDVTLVEEEAPYPSLYFRTCLEELTRNHLSYTMAAEDSPTLEVEDSKPQNAASWRFPAVEQLDSLEVSEFKNDVDETTSKIEPDDKASKNSRFLQVYHPHAVPQMSNFRRVPPDNRHILGDWTCGYTKLLVNVGPKFKIRYNNHVLFEPLFGSVSLYSANKKIDDDITKISESFHFDATPSFLRDSYKCVYQTDLDPEVHGDDEKNIDTQKIHPLSDCSRCLFCVPTDLIDSHDIFVVVHISKVLSGDPEKSLIPYTNPDKKTFLGSTSSDGQQSHAVVSCNRLHRFRQPVGVSAVKVFTKDGKVNNERIGLVAPVYAMKYCSNENSLKQLILDIQSEDSGVPANRSSSTHRALPPSTELDLCLTLLGLSAGGDLSEVPIPEGMPSVRTASNFRFFPSQYLNEDAANDCKWHDELGKDVADLVIVRTILPFTHPSCSSTDRAMSGFRASIDNSLFLYPTAIENLPKNFRNLTVRVQLVEFDELLNHDSNNMDESFYHTYKVLKNIYSTVPGDFFCQSAYTGVSYHRSNPELSDEIKIRLPLKLNRNHAIFFQFFHVHVKNKLESRRSSIFSSKHTEDHVTVLLGSGHLPLLINGNSVLPDGEHTISILENSESDTPTLRASVSVDTSHDSVSSLQSMQTYNSTRISASRRSLTNSSSSAKPMPIFTLHTKCLSSFISQNEELQDYLTCHPPCLGHLPSLSTAMMKSIEYSVLPREYVAPEEEKNRELSYNSPHLAVNEEILKEKTGFFMRLGSSSRSTKIEVCKHFFGIMRQLTRVMCGGGAGLFSTNFANPFTHTELRCTSFLAMLRVFSIMTPKNAQSCNTENSDNAKDSQTDFLRAYVNHMFDEEVYTYISPSKRKYDVDGSKAVKRPSKSLGVKLVGMLTKSATESKKSSEDDSGEDDALWEHVLQQIETVVLHGSVLSAVGKVTHEILEYGTIGPTSSTADDEENMSVEVNEPKWTRPRWWKGCTELKPLLSVLTEIPALEKALQMSRKNVNPLKESIVIDPLLDPFDRLDGFSLRSFAMEEEFHQKKLDGSSEKLKSSDEDKKRSPYNYLTLQWWPWMYEVISYQWISLLHIFQEDLLDKKGVAVEEISKIEEVADEDDEIENGKESLHWNSDNSYPLNELKEFFVKKGAIRTLLINHGPILLAMILKSIAFRIYREQKSTPVIMDKDFMKLMEELLGTLAREVHSKGISLLPARNLNIAISHFLRDMFALIAPLQSAQLVYSYFLSSRKTQKHNFEKTNKVQVNQITDRFYFLKELILTDHFFAFNFPLHLGSPHAAYKFSPIFSINDLIAASSVSSIRGIKSPPSHWLAHLLIYEVMSDFDLLEKNLKESAMKLIRSLAVRLCYDKRFQSKEYKHRVASMFIPLLSCIVEDVKHIQGLSRSSEERKDCLALVLFILQDIPDYLLREELRDMMDVVRVNPIKLKYHRITDTDNSISSPFKMGSSSYSELQHLLIFDLIDLFHLMVDTFEFPLSLGGDEGDISICLSSSVGIDGMDGFNIPNTKSNTTRKGTIGSKERVGTNDALSMLENMHAKRDKKVVRKRTSGDKSTGLESVDESASARSSSPNSKKNSNSNSVVIDAATTLRPNRKTGVKQNMVGMLQGLNAVKHVSKAGTTVLLNTLHIVIVESMKKMEPNVQSIYCDTKFGPQMSEIVSVSLNLLLHLLHTKQSEDAMCHIYGEATQTLTILGAKNFMRFLSVDTLQFWIRQVLLQCGSFFSALRESAASFFGELLYSCFDNFGSLRPVCVPVFGVMRDMVDELEKQYKSRPELLESEKYLDPLYEALEFTRMVITSKDNESSGSAKSCTGIISAVDSFFDTIRGLAKVYAFINLKLDYLKVVFDWNGGNGLDSMDYEDSSHNHVGFDVKGLITTALKGLDIDSVLDVIVTVATTLADYDLPRTQIYLLENLARTQDMLGNNAESGVARWEIYLILKKVEENNLLKRKKTLMIRYWCPRPPLKLLDATGDFMTVLRRSISTPSPTPWQSEQQFYKHMETVLTVCMKRFKDAKLTYLAERSLHELIACYRRENFDENESLPLIAKTYAEIHELYAQASVGSTTFAMGTFYRVLFLGKDVSDKIRNQEYVVRNADYLHLSEFQTLIKNNLLLQHVEKDIPITVLPDTSPMPADDAPGAFIVMTALKPTFKNQRDNVYSKNCLQKFHFSVPFTQGGKSHAKTIDLQWKRTIHIEVPQPFPYLTFRQCVSRRTSRELSPIEVAIDDIEERIVAMRLQMQLKSSKDQMFINNLMRLVQGTVAPQVNAGATEVAKSFLPKIESGSGENSKLSTSKSEDNVKDHNVIRLKEVLIDFLKLSKEILDRARLLLGTGDERKNRLSITADNTNTTNSTDGIDLSNTTSHNSTGSGSSSSVTGSPNQPPPPPDSSPQTKVDDHHTLWQMEMDKGYELLLDTIYPYLSDIVAKKEFFSDMTDQ